MTTRTPTLITTPAEVAYCDRCDQYGARFPGDVRTFPHCSSCGSTDLADTRSVFEVLAEARILAAEDGIDVYRKMDRDDVAWRLEVQAADADPTHCSDCASWARKVRVTA